MAQIDDKSVQITFGIVGSDAAVLDLLVIQGAKLGLVREVLESVPVVRFALKPRVLERQLIIVMSGLPLDIIQADAVIALDDGYDRLADLLDVYDLLPLDPSEMTPERLLNGAGGADPVKLLLHTTSNKALRFEGFDTVAANLRTGDGVSAAINPLVNRIATELANGQGRTRPCPAVVMHATHRADASELGAGFARPGAKVTLNVSLHEPFGTPGEREWSCALGGTIDAVTGLHTAQATMRPAGPVPEDLLGQWRVELFREREIWMLRSMSR